jgi:hypothetical protein
MERISYPSWKGKYDKLKYQIEEAYYSSDLDIFPSLDEINRLQSLAKKFRDQNELEFAREKSFELKRDYIKKWNSLVRKMNKANVPEEPSGEEKIPLEEEVAASLKDIINKVASDFNIGASDKVTIKLNEGQGLIKFDGIEYKKAFDWSGAVINKAVDLFSDLPIVSNDTIGIILDVTKDALDVSINDPQDKKIKYSELLEDAFDLAMEDSDLYQLIKNTSKKLGASKEITFLKFLEEERNLRSV